MVRIVETIPVAHATKAVLLGATSQLRPPYDLMLARESGDWASSGKVIMFDLLISGVHSCHVISFALELP